MSERTGGDLRGTVDSAGSVAQPVVSVVIPAYDPGRYLAEALDSVVAQTFEGWQAIVVDDGSAEDLSWVADRDPRIHYVRTPNQGVARARNHGIAASRSEWVAFLDADDLWSPRKLEVQLQVAAASGAEMVDCAFAVVEPDGTVDHYSTAWRPIPHRSDYVQVLAGNHIGMSCPMVKRTVLERVGHFDPRFHAVADWEMWLRITASGVDIVRGDDTPLASWRIHPASMSSDYVRMAAETDDLLAQQRDRAAERGDDALVARVKRTHREQRRRIASVALERVVPSLRAGDRRAAMRHLVQAQRLSPTALVPQRARTLWSRAQRGASILTKRRPHTA